MPVADPALVSPRGAAAVAVRDLAPQVAPSIEWTVDAEGALRFEGSAEEVLGAGPGADLDGLLRIVLAPILIVLGSGASWDDYQLERSVESATGPRHLRVRCRRSPGGDGHVGVVMAAADHRRVEEDLGDLIDRYRLLVELSPDMILVHQDGVLRYMNPTGVRWLGGADAGDIVGRPMLDFVAPSSLAALRDRIAELDRPGAVSQPTGMTLLTMDGRQLLVESQSVRTTWEGRSAFQVFLRDLSERNRAEAALRYQANLLSSVSDAVVATDLAGLITGWNPAAATLYQVAGSDALGRLVGDVLGRDATTSDGHVRPGVVGHHRADGSEIAVRVAVALLRDDLGRPCGEVAVCTDQTERLLAAAAREQAENRFTTVVTALSEAIVVAECDGTISSLNPSASTLFGPHLHEGSNLLRALAATALFDTQGGPVAPGEDPLSAAVVAGSALRDQIIGYEIDGARHWLSVNSEILDRGADGTPASVVCSVTDVTERRVGSERLAHAAAHDALTGLANRPRLLEMLDRYLAESTPVAVLFVDIDRFKVINDSYGHMAGDRVLRTIASRIRHLVEPFGTVGRLAGDEFVIVLPSTTPSAAAASAERICGAIAMPIEVVGGREVAVTVSIGIAGTGTGDVTADELLGDADMAMYEAKQRGRARIEVFDTALRAATVRRLDLADRLRRAVGEDQIEVHYQPLVSFDTLETVGFEALARWTDGELGPVGPDEFIPIAEDHGLITALGRSVLRRACMEAARWPRPPGPAPLTVSVNVSACQLGDPGLVHDVSAALADSGLAPGRLVLEVTESVLMNDVTASIAVLRVLQATGVHLVVDDFGTGYSSLNYLRHLPVDAMKIDRSFVADLGVSMEDDAVVDAIIQLGHSLGLTITAEGVETVAQAAILTRMGCDTAQGWLYGRPVDNRSTRRRLAAEARPAVAVVA